MQLILNVVICMQQRKKCIETAVTKPFTLLKRLLFYYDDSYKLHVCELQYTALVNVEKANEYMNTPSEHLNTSLMTEFHKKMFLQHP